MTLEDLLTRAKKQDMQSLAALHDQLYPLVYRYVSYRLEDEQTREDIVSETFVRLLDVLNRPGQNVQDVRAWLIGTAAHLVSDHYRRQYHRPESDLAQHEDLPDGHTPEHAAEQNQARSEVHLALKKLTGDQQHVLALRFSQEFSLEETARLMKKSVNAVKVLQFRALAALRRAMDERGKAQ
ncbi:MAG: sigma-70 family RNA polymerase sigma factor [Chloroflexi bacterium]|nr:sigma-70 family RNA polymerase sigma factor [Chloroflexota bacterium]